LSIGSHWRESRRRKAAQTRLDEISERAANLGKIVEWDGQGIMKVKEPENLGAVAEIVQSAGTGHPYRVKLYDKRAALDAIARYLGMMPLKTSSADDDEPTPEEAGYARQRLIDGLDRLAAKARARSTGQEPHE
jgi:hypothetical protein